MAATRIKTQDIADSAVTTGKINDAAVTAAKLDVLQAKGDVLIHDGSTHGRLPVGSNGQYLVADSGEPTGLAWATFEGIDQSSFVTGETPTGAIDGVNDDFTLANTPITGSAALYKNGIRQRAGAGNDYTIASDTITFEAGNIPQSGDVLVVDYRK